MPGLPRASAHRLETFNDWKFGLFVHFGPWAQTGHAKIWDMVRLPAAERGDWTHLNRTFNPTKFDPSVWARAARQAGMRYAYFTTKHHDGFCNWATRTTAFSVAGADCPVSRWRDPDLVGQVASAMRAEGLAYGHYYSHIDWSQPDGRRFSFGHPDYDPAAVHSDPAAWRRWVAFETAQVEELLTRYGKVDLMWWDIAWPIVVSDPSDMPNSIRRPYADPVVADAMTRLIARVRTLAPELIMNERGVQPYADYVSPEQSVPAIPPPGPWEAAITVTGPGRREVGGFWWQGANASYKSTAKLIRALCEVASRGGNLLLGVGPNPDGELPPEELHRLAEIGTWMGINGEAIYGTHAGGVEAPWGMATRKERYLYLLVFDRPAAGEPLRVPGRNAAREAVLLGTGKPLAIGGSADGGLTLTWPDAPRHPVADVVRLRLA